MKKWKKKAVCKTARRAHSQKVYLEMGKKVYENNGNWEIITKIKKIPIRKRNWQMVDKKKKRFVRLRDELTVKKNLVKYSNIHTFNHMIVRS